MVNHQHGTIICVGTRGPKNNSTQLYDIYSCHVNWEKRSLRDVWAFGSFFWLPDCIITWRPKIVQRSLAELFNHWHHFNIVSYAGLTDYWNCNYIFLIIRDNSLNMILLNMNDIVLIFLISFDVRSIDYNFLFLYLILKFFLPFFLIRTLWTNFGDRITCKFLIRIFE